MACFCPASSLEASCGALNSIVQHGFVQIHVDGGRRAKAIQNSRSRKRREGRFVVRLRMASCWRRARISAISSTRGTKNERARERRRGKRARSEKQGQEIWIRKVGE